MPALFLWYKLIVVVIVGGKIAGVTLMALGAMAKYEGLDVKIVPCGTFYSF